MDLDCFVHETWAPRIRPADPRRAWMDATPEQFAYRCLPLAIANAHGWELLSPVGFRARWRGGGGTDAVEIRVDPGMEGRERPTSLFGQGTITFHVEGLFRTPPGWNLWVGGSPNAAKDGIAPLSGVIETDWSPYTFTMNWRFTRANHWVRFEENEPFCFFFPVQRQALAEFTPRVRPVEEAPELKAAFDAWSGSRAAFQQRVKETRPQAPADQWQKLYFQGRMPDGAAGAPDHRTKLRPPPFAGAEAAGCPVAHRPAPPPAPLPASPSVGAALLAPAAGPLPDDVMRMTLQRLGLPPAGGKRPR